MSGGLELLFRADPLARFVAFFVVVFSLLIGVYSIGYLKKKPGSSGFFVCFFLTLAASVGTVFADNLVLFAALWGFLGLLLYLMVGLSSRKRAEATAKKALIIIGGTDALMLLGLALAWKLTGTFRMSQMRIPVEGGPAAAAYLCLAAAALAKAGAMPFHTWVPDTAEDAPIPVTAYLPASLDKLLGIYFLARLSLEIFRLNAGMNMVLLIIGSVTIVGAVMMALIQHDLKRLLGYHAVSQVGYMVLGIGTGNPVGIAGGLFHMLNNAVYKSSLFLSAGAVEKRAGTSNLDRLGGLAGVMPLTFFIFLISSLAISGVPPLNGFASKWMIYQGVIELGREGGTTWVIWLAAAMFGSALTLASFMKLLHAVFLGRPAERNHSPRKRETSPLMWVPGMILAILCVVFGVFAYRIPLGLFIVPALGREIVFPGAWMPGTAAVLLLAAIAAGALIYGAGRLKARRSDAFVGGEDIARYPEMRLSGTGFYETVRELPLLKTLYALAERKVFDPYDVGVKATLGLNALLSRLHSGILPTYLSWCLLGMLALFYFLLR